MLGYFPQVYPQELLYSVLARYHRHMGAPSFIQSMESLFGRRLVIANPDLPEHIDALAARIPPGRHLTADRIIDTMTLYPYYTAYQSQDVRLQVRHAMQVGEECSVLLRLGIAAFRAGRVTQLRFCGSCLAQMRERYGELYWRRDHQLPSALVCPEHATPLQISPVRLTGRSRHYYVAADRETCAWQAPALAQDIAPPTADALHRLAVASAALLDDPGPPMTPRALTTFYRRAVQRTGLASLNVRVDQRQLDQAFRHHYRGCLPMLPGVMTGSRFTGDWLAAFVRKQRKACHPLQHLMVRDFLASRDSAGRPFGEGPWPCCNPLASHRGEAVVSDCRFHRNRAHMVGVFTCSCGYAYTRSFHPDMGKVGAPRFQAFGPSLGSVLGEMVAAGCSLREIARRLEIDPKTVLKLAAEGGIRTRWKAASDRSPGSPRKTPTAVARSPVLSRKRSARCPRRNWAEIDTQVATKVREAAELIRAETPLVRVTIAAVERRFWNRGWICKRATKLPVSMQALGDVAESLESFQRRRAWWTILQMDRADEPLQVWRILRKAGLTDRHTSMVEGLLATHFDQGQAAA